jgi:hypothetical protein
MRAKERYFISAVVAYIWAVFAFAPIALIIAGSKTHESFVLIGIVTAFSVPCVIATLVVGFPKFKLAISVFKKENVFSVLLSGIASAIVCALLSVLLISVFTWSFNLIFLYIYIFSAVVISVLASLIFSVSYRWL